MPVRWSGSLEWFTNSDRQEKLASQIAEQIEWGEPARMIDSNEFALLEPGVLFEPNSALPTHPTTAPLTQLWQHKNFWPPQNIMARLFSTQANLQT